VWFKRNLKYICKLPFIEVAQQPRPWVLLGKIVFVENRNASSQREWLTLLSTDTNLTDEEIIRIYGKRWDIGVPREGYRIPTGISPVRVKRQSPVA